MSERLNQTGGLPMFDGLEARRGRDEGMEKVADPTLTDQLGHLLDQHLGEQLTGEDIRALSGLEAHHPNAWGAAINALVRRQRLVKTGEYRNMKRPSSHARVNPVYVVRAP